MSSTITLTNINQLADYVSNIDKFIEKRHILSKENENEINHVLTKERNVEKILTFTNVDNLTTYVLHCENLQYSMAHDEIPSYLRIDIIDNHILSLFDNGIRDKYDYDTEDEEPDNEYDYEEEYVELHDNCDNQDLLKIE